MRLVSYERDAQWCAGMLVDDVVVDLHDVATEVLGAGVVTRQWHSLRWVLEHVAESDLASVHRHASADESGVRGHAVAEVRLGPPIPDPRKIICIGLNYPLHADEVGLKTTTHPEMFAKYSNALAGPADDIVMPALCSQLDYEGELAVVIGKRCKGVRREDAHEVIAGYMAFNDVSARDLQLRTSQWLPGKSCDTFAPCGPALVTPDEVADLDSLSIVTRVNGETVQDDRLGSMTFSVADLIAEVSALMTLEVGDVIATGTPQGVGLSFDPPRFLRPGDEVVVDIERVGRLINVVTAEGDSRSEAEDR